MTGENKFTGVPDARFEAFEAPGCLMSTSPQEAQAKTIARGKIRELAEQNPELAAELSAIGAKLGHQIVEAHIIAAEIKAENAHRIRHEPTAPLLPEDAYQIGPRNNGRSQR